MQLGFVGIRRNIGFGEIGFGKIGFGEIGFGETGFGEIGFGEIGFGEIGFGKIGHPLHFTFSFVFNRLMFGQLPLPTYLVVIYVLFSTLYGIQ
jgi:hypothetical protein